MTMNELKNETNSLSTGLFKKLQSVQKELKAPKNQYNSFGKYNYRSCEDILEGIKPLLVKHDMSLVLSDELVNIGERYYIKATVTLIDCATGEQISNTAYAREELDKKGMDGSQITGTSSSYARKYALNGMFLIDDTKDADSDEFVNQTKDTTKAAPKVAPKKADTTKPTEATMKQVNIMRGECQIAGIELADEAIVNFIKKNMNGKHQIVDMNEQELLRYIKVLDTMLQKKKGNEGKTK